MTLNSTSSVHPLDIQICRKRFSSPLDKEKNLAKSKIFFWCGGEDLNSTSSVHPLDIISFQSILSQKVFKSSRQRKKILRKARFFSLCPGEDLNLHGFPHTHLKRAWLPITAPGQYFTSRRGAIMHENSYYFNLLASQGVVIYNSL